MATKCCTKCVITPIIHIWEIDNFQWFLANRNRIKSSTFVCPEKDHSWYLVAYLKGSKEEHSNYISLYLYLNSCLKNDRNVRASYAFSIVDPNGIKLHLHKSKEEGYTFQLGNNLSNWGIHRFVKSSQILEKHWTFDQKLMIMCEVKEIKDQTTLTELIPMVKEIPIDLSPGLSEFYHKKEFTDLIIESGSKKLDAHKVVVCSASKVFKSMFEANLDESQSNRIRIEDFDFEVVKLMVEFLYTKKAENMDSHACELLLIADKYDIECLKKYSESYLCSIINNENALRLLSLAQHCHCDILTTKCIQFIESNAKLVFERKDWIDFNKEIT